MEENEKVEPEELKKIPNRVSKKVEPDPEWIATMQKAHELKVMKFLAGGEF